MIARFLMGCLCWLWPRKQVSAAEEQVPEAACAQPVAAAVAAAGAGTCALHLAARLRSAASLNRRKTALRLARNPERLGRPKLVVVRKRKSSVETRHVWLQVRHVERDRATPVPATVVPMRRPQRAGGPITTLRRAA